MIKPRLGRTFRGRSGRAPRILLIIENISIGRDHRAQKQIKALLGAGYRVGLICRRDEANDRFRRPGLRLYEYPAPPEREGAAFVAFEYLYSLIAAVGIVIRAMTGGRIHAIQVGQPPDIYFLPALMRKLFRTRFIVDQRDLSPEIYAARFGKSEGAVVRMLRALERASWRTADHVLTVNRSLAGVVTDRGGLPAERVTVIANGPSLSAVSGREPEESLREGFPHLVCWHGVMGPQDHVELGLHAIAHYVHELGRRDALFVFMGDGVALPGLRELAEELQIEDVVRFTGWLDEDSCFTYLASADLGLDTNLESEVTPVKGMEYMGHGLPIVAFDLHETRVLADEAARYAPAGDVEAMARAIAALLDSPEERHRLGRIGRERIEQEFAWDRQEERYLATYDEILSGAGT